jgi:carbon storage regulator
MLVLNRSVDESIAIGDSIVITILEIEGDRIKIGIQAPKEITILRGEIREALLDQVKIQQKMAQGIAAESFSDLRKVLVEETEELNSHSQENNRKE